MSSVIRFVCYCDFALMRYVLCEHCSDRKLVFERHYMYMYLPNLYCRPRLLLSGDEGQGQTTHLAPAVLHQLERLPVHTLDLPALFANSAKTPEESCAQARQKQAKHSTSIYVRFGSRWKRVYNQFVSCYRFFVRPSEPLQVLSTCHTFVAGMTSSAMRRVPRLYRCSATWSRPLPRCS